MYIHGSIQVGDPKQLNMYIDVRQCMDQMKGEDSQKEVVKIVMPASSYNRSKTATVTKQSMRRLRLHWMYKDKTFLWLNDEVSSFPLFLTGLNN